MGEYEMGNYTTKKGKKQKVGGTNTSAALASARH